MTENEFWNLIDTSRAEAGERNVEGQVVVLVAALAGLPTEDIISFQKHFSGFSREAYDFRLFAAASVLDDLSDDGFHDFRSWLVSRGKTAFFRCLNDPETLAEIADLGDRVAVEEMGWVASEAYKQKTGRDDFDLLSESVPYPEFRNYDLKWVTPEGYADEARLKVLFPKLWAKFGTRFNPENW